MHACMSLRTDELALAPFSEYTRKQTTLKMNEKVCPWHPLMIHTVKCAGMGPFNIIPHSRNCALSVRDHTGVLLCCSLAVAIARVLFI